MADPQTQKVSNLWSVFFIVVGALTISIGIIIHLIFPDIPEWIIEIIQIFGTTLTSVFSVSIIYEIFIAEKQFDNFRILLMQSLKEMDSIQSKCIKLGIGKIFETRNEFERKIPFIDVINESPENSSILCVGKSLFYILNKTGEFKEALNKGMRIELACVNPQNINSTLVNVSQLFESDIYSALNPLKELIKWAIVNNANGSIELRYHNTDYPDSVLIFSSSDGQEKVCWDLSFGRDLNQKRVIFLYVDHNTLGNDLKNRYLSVWNDACPQIKYANNQLEVNAFNWDFNN